MVGQRQQWVTTSVAGFSKAPRKQQQQSLPGRQTQPLHELNGAYAATSTIGNSFPAYTSSTWEALSAAVAGATASGTAFTYYSIQQPTESAVDSKDHGELTAQSLTSCSKSTAALQEVPAVQQDPKVAQGTLISKATAPAAAEQVSACDMHDGAGDVMEADETQQQLELGDVPASASPAHAAAVSAHSSPSSKAGEPAVQQSISRSGRGISSSKGQTPTRAAAAATGRRSSATAHTSSPSSATSAAAAGTKDNSSSRRASNSNISMRRSSNSSTGNRTAAVVTTATPPFLRTAARAAARGTSERHAAAQQHTTTTINAHEGRHGRSSSGMGDQAATAAAAAKSTGSAPADAVSSKSAATNSTAASRMERLQRLKARRQGIATSTADGLQGTDSSSNVIAGKSFPAIHSTPMPPARQQQQQEPGLSDLYPVIDASDIRLVLHGSAPSDQAVVLAEAGSSAVAVAARPLRASEMIKRFREGPALPREQRQPVTGVWFSDHDTSASALPPPPAAAVPAVLQGHEAAISSSAVPSAAAAQLGIDHAGEDSMLWGAAVAAAERTAPLAAAAAAAPYPLHTSRTETCVHEGMHGTYEHSDHAPPAAAAASSSAPNPGSNGAVLQLPWLTELESGNPAQPRYLVATNRPPAVVAAAPAVDTDATAALLERCRKLLANKPGTTAKQQQQQQGMLIETSGAPPAQQQQQQMSQVVPPPCSSNAGSSSNNSVWRQQLRRLLEEFGTPSAAAATKQQQQQDMPPQQTAAVPALARAEDLLSEWRKQRQQSALLSPVRRIDAAQRSSAAATSPIRLLVQQQQQQQGVGFVVGQQSPSKVLSSTSSSSSGLRVQPQLPDISNWRQLLAAQSGSSSNNSSSRGITLRSPRKPSSEAAAAAAAAAARAAVLSAGLKALKSPDRLAAAAALVQGNSQRGSSSISVLKGEDLLTNWRQRLRAAAESPQDAATAAAAATVSDNDRSVDVTETADAAAAGAGGGGAGKGVAEVSLPLQRPKPSSALASPAAAAAVLGSHSDPLASPITAAAIAAVATAAATAAALSPPAAARALFPATGSASPGSSRSRSSSSSSSGPTLHRSVCVMWPDAHVAVRSADQQKQASSTPQGLQQQQQQQQQEVGGQPQPQQQPQMQKGTAKQQFTEIQQEQPPQDDGTLVADDSISNLDDAADCSFAPTDSNPQLALSTGRTTAATDEVSTSPAEQAANPGLDSLLQGQVADKPKIQSESVPQELSSIIGDNSSNSKKSWRAVLASQLAALNAASGSSSPSSSTQSPTAAGAAVVDGAAAAAEAGEPIQPAEISSDHAPATAAAVVAVDASELRAASYDTSGMTAAAAAVDGAAAVAAAATDLAGILAMDALELTAASDGTSDTAAAAALAADQGVDGGDVDGYLAAAAADHVIDESSGLQTGTWEVQELVIGSPMVIAAEQQQVPGDFLNAGSADAVVQGKAGNSIPSDSIAADAAEAAAVTAAAAAQETAKDGDKHLQVQCQQQQQRQQSHARRKLQLELGGDSGSGDSITPLPQHPLTAAFCGPATAAAAAGAGSSDIDSLISPKTLVKQWAPGGKCVLSFAVPTSAAAEGVKELCGSSSSIHRPPVAGRCKKVPALAVNALVAAAVGDALVAPAAAAAAAVDDDVKQKCTNAAVKDAVISSKAKRFDTKALPTRQQETATVAVAEEAAEAGVTEGHTVASSQCNVSSSPCSPAAAAAVSTPADTVKPRRKPTLSVLLPMSPLTDQPASNATTAAAAAGSSHLAAAAALPPTGKSGRTCYYTHLGVPALSPDGTNSPRMPAAAAILSTAAAEVGVLVEDAVSAALFNSPPGSQVSSPDGKKQTVPVPSPPAAAAASPAGTPVIADVVQGVASLMPTAVMQAASGESDDAVKASVESTISLDDIPPPCVVSAASAAVPVDNDSSANTDQRAHSATLPSAAEAEIADTAAAKIYHSISSSNSSVAPTTDDAVGIGIHSPIASKDLATAAAAAAGANMRDATVSRPLEQQQQQPQEATTNLTPASDEASDDCNNRHDMTPAGSFEAVAAAEWEYAEQQQGEDAEPVADSSPEQQQQQHGVRTEVPTPAQQQERQQESGCDVQSPADAHVQQSQQVMSPSDSSDVEQQPHQQGDGLEISLAIEEVNDTESSAGDEIDT